MLPYVCSYNDPLLLHLTWERAFSFVATPQLAPTLSITLSVLAPLRWALSVGLCAVWPLPGVGVVFFKQIRSLVITRNQHATCRGGGVARMLATGCNGLQPAATGRNRLKKRCHSTEISGTQRDMISCSESFTGALDDEVGHIALRNNPSTRGLRGLSCSSRHSSASSGMVTSHTNLAMLTTAQMTTCSATPLTQGAHEPRNATRAPLRLP